MQCYYAIMLRIYPAMNYESTLLILISGEQVMFWICLLPMRVVITEKGSLCINRF